MKILITGVAGFIGSNLALKLLNDSKNRIIGIDNLNNYYDVKLKEYRLNKIKTFSNFTFINENIVDKDKMFSIFKKYKFDVVINLAAQAGVRYSITNPDSYIESNVIGFYNILEACRNYPVKHLIYASSSSIYGDNTKIPFAVDDKTDNPVSLYAATKKSNELFAYSYSKLYNIYCTGLRFFTVYGPCGRPDMAYFSFTDKLVKNEKIKVFNYGNCKRDFTYIDDVVNCIEKVVLNEPKRLYSLYNIGNSKPEKLLDFIKILSDELKKVGVLDKNFNIDEHIELVGKEKGDVDITYSDTTSFIDDYDYIPSTSLRKGLREFARWYKKFYGVRK